MPKNRLIGLIAVVVGVAAFAYVAIYGLHTDPRKLESALLGKRLPAFELSVLFEPETKVTEQDLIGKPALVNVWASWCPTCQAELSYLKQLSDSGVLIYGVNYRESDEPKARRWLDVDNPYKLNVSDPKNKLGMDLGVYGAPETFVIDHLGVIHMRHAGEVNEWVWKEEIGPLYERLVAEQEQQP